MSDSVVDLEKISKATLSEVKSGVVEDLLSFIKGRVAADFPKNLDKICDEFFETDIKTELLKYLRKNRAVILERLKKKIVGYALEKTEERMHILIDQSVESLLDEKRYSEDYE